MKTKFKSAIRIAPQLFSGSFLTVVVLLIAPGMLAQNLFEADWGTGNIYEFTPGGTQSTFATGLSDPEGLIFNSAGDLFAANVNNGTISEFTPSGAQSTFASGLGYVDGLAFNSAGDLFVANGNDFRVTEISPSGAQSTIAPVFEPLGLAFNRIHMPPPISPTTSTGYDYC